MIASRIESRSSTNNDFGTECIRCNDSLIAESQYVSERHVSHSWSCENCGQQFETSHHLDLEAKKPA
jgi:transcription elongation factor Elf1